MSERLAMIAVAPLWATAASGWVFWVAAHETVRALGFYRTT